MRPKDFWPGIAACLVLILLTPFLVNATPTRSDTAVATIDGMGTCAPRPVATGVKYGAIAARGGDEWRCANADDYDTQAEADAAALRICGAGCSVVLQFYNSCGVYAHDRSAGSTAAGWAANEILERAVQAAVANCRARGGRNCGHVPDCVGCAGK